MPRVKRDSEMPNENEQDAMEIRQRNLLAAMSYVLFLFIVPMFIGKKDAFLQFHMRQGFALFVCTVVASFFVYIPFIGWAMPAILVFIAVYAASRALEGKTWRIPYVSSFADKVEL